MLFHFVNFEAAEGPPALYFSKCMIINDLHREDNYQEYLRLRNDPNYSDVIFDDVSGGVSAVHRNHQFDSQIGAFGIKKGDYEKISVNILRERGHAVILESETAPDGIMSPDGFIDGIIMEIKAVEGQGKWAIKDKLHIATRQGASCVILYFHDKKLYSYERIEDGWFKYLNDQASQKYNHSIERVLCIVGEDIHEFSIP